VSSSQLERYFEWSVGSKSVGIRLDTFLAGKLPALSRTRSMQWIEKGWVQVEGQAGKKARRLKSGQKVEMRIPLVSLWLPPEGIPRYQVLAEDDALLVVNKPPHLPVHPSGGRIFQTLIQQIREDYADLHAESAGRLPSLCHRLDTGTSGVMLIGKKDEAVRNIGRQFAEGRVKKEYLAIVHGHLSPAEGLVEAPIGPDSEASHRSKQKVQEGGVQAITRYQTLEVAPDYAFLKVCPQTGRSHQIRVHMAWAGCPLVGDSLYGKSLSKDARRHPYKAVDARHFLHSSQIGFTHPVSGEEVTAKAPLLEDMRFFWEAMMESGG
jgi:23S rRNA pseudouridine1911/1915/1917 synthase